MATYYATKNYVLRLTEALREELRRAGSPVRVCALCPGPVDTEFNKVAGVRFSLSGLSAERVAREAVDGLFAGKAVVVPECSHEGHDTGASFRAGQHSCPYHLSFSA